MSTPSTITSPTRKLSQQQVDVLKSLQPGQRIRVVQTVRVGAKKWQAMAEGTFREINYLATGVTTDRVPGAGAPLTTPAGGSAKRGGSVT